MKVLRAGLIGEHISRTRLPAALEIMCGLAGWRLEFERIETAERPDFDFDAFVERVRGQGWAGVTVTHPWKPMAAAYAGDRMRPELRGLGASNTLVFGPPLSGHNTDFTGFLGAWKANMHGSPGRVGMAGAGGVARALGPALARLGASEIAVWDRNEAAARSLVDLIGAPARLVPFGEAAQAIRRAEGLVNATPLGMKEYPGTAFDPSLLPGRRWAFDAVYTPTMTRFLQDAGRAGLACLTGFELFRYMAIGTFAAYTGIALDPAKVLPMLASLRPDLGGKPWPKS